MQVTSCSRKSARMGVAGLWYSMSQKNVSKNVQFRFQKRKLSFNAFAVFSSRSVSFPSINRSVSFRSVLSRSLATTLAVEWCAVSVLSSRVNRWALTFARGTRYRSAARYLLVQPSPRSSQLCQTRSPWIQLR